jgi:RNA polymerase sigma-70 factor, ECF subfamily
MKIGNLLSSYLDLAVLLRQAQAGDASAFDLIFQRFATPLFRYLYVRCGDVDMAEEIASSTWVRAVEQLASFQIGKSNSSTFESAFGAWLFRIGHNLMIDAYRRRSRSTVPLEDSLVQGDMHVEEHILDTETHQELRTALLKLTPAQREVVLLRFVEERSTAEVAHLTERTEGAVKALQHRALAALARFLTTARGGQET